MIDTSNFFKDFLNIQLETYPSQLFNNDTTQPAC